MEQLLKLLQDKFPQIDFAAEENLVDDGLLDSVAVLGIIAEIEDAFDVSVTMEYIQPQYFNSVSAMWEMIEELQ
ncbi:MAG: acyl carrier protein [Clostridiales bacterium]|nr:acyl carrier protein [Clostridiales bacterium]